MMQTYIVIEFDITSFSTLFPVLDRMQHANK